MEDDDYRALQEQAHQVEELTKHPGWEVFVDGLRFSKGALAAKQQELVRGGAKTFDEYQRRVGWIEGCQATIDFPERLRKQVDSETQTREAVKRIELEEVV